MKALLVAVFMVLTGVGIASAGEEQHKIELKVVKSGDGSDHTVHWSGDGSALEALEVGESKTLEGGVVVTRTDDGMSFNINGETIDVPHMSDHPSTTAFRMNGDHNVEIIDGGPHMAVRAHSLHDGIMIASGEAIDETTQETIRSVLASAGYDADVRFIDRGSLHARHVTVIKERIEEVQED